MRRFADAVQRPDEDIELDRAALLLGEWEDGPIDLGHYLHLLDDLAFDADRARHELADRSFAGARAISRVLFVDCGYRGNTDDYYDPRNSFLGAVLDRRV